MRTIPISQVAELEHDEQVPSVQGRITAVYEYKKDSNARGAFSFQNVMLRDETGEIKVKLKDREEMPSNWKGKAVKIECVKGDKGMSGVKAKDDEYRGKVTRVLWVTPSAKIAPFAEQMNTDRQVDTTPARQAAKQATPAPARKEAPPQQAPQPHANGNGHEGGVTDVKKRLNRMANLYVHCMEAAAYVRQTWDELHPDEPMSMEQYQACTSSLFINASPTRREIDLATFLPVGRFK